MRTQAALWTIAGLATAVAAVAVLADRRRTRRGDLDRVGWVPWPLILLLALIIAAVSAAFALKS